jgi:epoxyqueuosine reductase QueG
LTINLEAIKNFAEKNNIIAGVCHAAPLEVETRLASPFVPFVSADEKKRTDPSATLRGVESIVVVGCGNFEKEKKREENDASVFALSSLGANEDYHIRVKKILRELVRELKIFGDFKYKILVDSPGLDERALAHRAGLGFFGRNKLIISEKFGTRFNIGCLLTNMHLPENFFQKKISCPPDCDLCIKNCPNNALSHEKFHAERCISYLTQKEELSPTEMKMLHGQHFGCDICQDVCPFNGHILRQSVGVNPQEWREMSDDDFREKYGHTSMLWRGAEILRRNAKINLLDK